MEYVEMAMVFYSRLGEMGEVVMLIAAPQVIWYLVSFIMD